MPQVVEVTLDKNGEAEIKLYGHDIKIVAKKSAKKAAEKPAEPAQE